MLPLALAVALAQPVAAVEATIVARRDGSYWTEQNRCSSRLSSFRPPDQIVCVDRERPILWRAVAEGMGVNGWLGWRIPMPAGYTAEDIARFAVLEESLLFLSYRRGELYAYKDGEAQALEYAGVGEIAAAPRLGVAYYRTEEPAEAGSTLHRLKRVDRDLLVDTLWESTQHSLERFWEVDGTLNIELRSGAGIEFWELPPDATEWRQAGRHEPPPIHPLTEWVVIEPFAADSVARSCANREFRRVWRVATGPDGPTAEAYRYRDRPEAAIPFWLPPGRGRTSAIRVADGYLVGFDKGEFGGGLWWYSENGRDGYRVTEANVRGFAGTPSETVALTGLAHLMSDAGGVLRLARNRSNRWHVAEEVDLDASPSAFLTETDGSVTIVTGNGLLSYVQGTVESLHESDYTLLSVNSVVRTPDRELLIGMRHVVARLTPVDRGYRETWLAPPDCVTLEPAAGFRCECVSGPHE